jgi:hypothetical protein
MKPLSARDKQSALLRVNWAHPLARGLRDCIVFNAGGQWGLVNLGDMRGKPKQSTQSPGHYRASVGGPGRFTPEDDTGSTGTAFDWYIPNYINYSASDFSAFSRFVSGTNTTNNGFTSIFCKTNNTNGELGILLDLAANSIGSTHGNVTYRIFGGVGGTVAVATTIRPNKINDFAVTIHKSATGPIKYYANGALAGTDTGLDTTASTTDNTSLTLGRGPFANQSAPYDFQCFYTWSRQLSDAEYYQLHLDPYCFLENYDVGLRKTATTAIVEYPLKRRVRNLYFR